jgi:hypothetical protein
MRWRGFFRVKYALSSKRSVEDISLSEAYISWLYERAILIMSIDGNQE